MALSGPEACRQLLPAQSGLLNWVLSPSRNVYSAFALRRQVGTCHGRSHDNQMIGTYEFSQPSSRSQEVPSTFPPLEAFCRQEPAAASKVN